MKLHGTIGEFETSFEIQREGDRVFARVGEAKYSLDVRTTTTGSYLLALDGQIFDCRVGGPPQSGQPIDVIVGTETFTVKLTDPKRLRGSSDAAAHADATARIVAPMPGKVVRVLISAGDAVEAGAGIVVVEAMKMQNEMKAPKSGVVVAVNVEPGATVNGGDVLAIIE